MIKKLILDTETLRTLSRSTLCNVAGGKLGDAAQSIANLGLGRETDRCIISCFCTEPRDPRAP